jgi:hypothetical protein
MFLPQGQNTPEGDQGSWVKAVSSADEIGIALVIAGDPPKRLSLAVAPLVLAPTGPLREGLSDRRRPLATRPVGWVIGPR